VFDRFHQVEGTSEIEQIGTGIGLALTKELLNLMHGNVTVESTPGKGSKFKIILPLGKNHLKEKEFILIETEQIPDKGKLKFRKNFRLSLLKKLFQTLMSNYICMLTERKICL